jgi:hypothetical protein
MNKVYYIFWTIGIAIAFVGCEKTDNSTQIINPVYRYLSDVKRTHDFVPDSLNDAVKAMMSVMGVDSIDSQILNAWSSSSAVCVFTPPVDSVYPTLIPLEHQLGVILKNAEDEGLNLPNYSYAAVVWGKHIPIVFVDDIMLIALNHYLGSTYPGYSRWPEYQRITKSPDFLPYDLAEALVASNNVFVGDTNKATVLNLMLYNGAITEAKMRLVEDADEAHALGYTDEQMQWLNVNERELWQSLVGKNLLYDVSDFTKEKLIDPTPATSILSANAPGRVGRFLGYKIVKAYLKHNPDKKLKHLLLPEFYMSKETLINAQYEPK